MTEGWWDSPRHCNPPLLLLLQVLLLLLLMVEGEVAAATSKVEAPLVHVAGPSVGPQAAQAPQITQAPLGHVGTRPLDSIILRAYEKLELTTLKTNPKDKS